MKNAVIYARVSTDKQNQEGNSTNDQINACNYKAKELEYEIKSIFADVITGTISDRPRLNDLLTFCKNKENNISAVFVRAIDRLSREGVGGYTRIKDQLKEMGIVIIDVTSIVQPEVNALAHLGTSYSWSLISPSQTAEVQKAIESENERKNILCRTIGAEIAATKSGLWMRNPPYGLASTKKYNEYGQKVTILIPLESEAYYIKKIFDLKTTGINTDKQIVEIVNNLGYKSRIFYVRDKQTGTIKGQRGGAKLKVKQLQRYLSRPIYAGIICEQWTWYKPVLAQFEGLISIEQWNTAQDGKRILVLHEDKTIELITDPKFFPKKKTRENELYPYKNIVLCPECQKPFHASASTGKSGTRYPAYHCNRNHKLLRISKDTFEKEILKYFESLNFTKIDFMVLNYSLRKVWKRKTEDSRKSKEYYENTQQELELTRVSLFNKLMNLSNPTVLKMIEDKIEEIDNQKKSLIKQKEEDHLSERELDELISFSNKFFEHLPNIFAQKENAPLYGPLFKVLFSSPPTYQEIQFRTPKIKPYFRLKDISSSNVSQLVTPRGFEPRFEP